MFVISFDLNTLEAIKRHPKGVRQAYRDIAKVLEKYGFKRVQLSVFAAQDENLLDLIRAANALKDLEWFKFCVKNIRAFRMEHGTDLTALFQDRLSDAPKP